MPDFCFMKLSTWPLKTVDSFENLKCNAFTFLPHRWAYDVMYYKKNGMIGSGTVSDSGIWLCISDALAGNLKEVGE